MFIIETEDDLQQIPKRWRWDGREDTSLYKKEWSGKEVACLRELYPKMLTSDLDKYTILRNRGHRNIVKAANRLKIKKIGFRGGGVSNPRLMRDVCFDYADGLKVSEIMKKHGIKSSVTIVNYLIKNDFPRNRKLIDFEKVKNICSDYLDGVKLKDIRSKYKVCRGTIYAYLRSSGFSPTRHRKRA